MAVQDLTQQPRRPTIADGIVARPAGVATGFRSVLVSVVAASIVLLLCSARDLPRWADGKGGSDTALWLGDQVRAWDAFVAKWGFAAPHDRLRKSMRDWRHTEWRE
jgi:hypothetical protein